HTATCWGHADNRTALRPPGDAFESIVAGNGHNCGLHADGTIACWGTPELLAAPSGSFTQLAASEMNTCALGHDGSLSCWGADNYGLGTPPAGKFRSISAGSLHFCALRDDY